MVLASISHAAVVGEYEGLLLRTQPGWGAAGAKEALLSSCDLCGTGVGSSQTCCLRGLGILPWPLDFPRSVGPKGPGRNLKETSCRFHCDYWGVLHGVSRWRHLRRLAVRPGPSHTVRRDLDGVLSFLSWCPEVVDKICYD